MFYNAEMLSKRGPLARVWMASHLTAKISKTNLLSTSIPASVTSILGEKLLPMALRLSGQLLLGVTRIYSRKAKYLLEDCNETLGRVKRAFRPGVVDMIEGEGRAKDGITMKAQVGGLEEMNNDAGLNYDWAMENAAGPSKARNPKANVSTNEEISLPENTYTGYSQFGFDEGGIGSQDMMEGNFDEGFELGILDDEEMLMDLLPGGGDEFDPLDPKGKKRARTEDQGSDDESIEMGRDNAGSVGHASARGSIGGVFGGKGDEFDGEGDVTMQSGLGGQFDLEEGVSGRRASGPEDMGGMDDFIFDDFGGGDEQFAGPRTPRAGTADPEQTEESLALTPKTAADLNKLATKSVTKKVKTVKKQVVDKVTELEWESGARAAQKENLFTEPQYLPNSRIHLHLLEMANSTEPSPYLPKLNDPKGKTYNLAPPGLALELHSLYDFPSRRSRIDAEVGRKRAISVDVEVGRRAQSEMNGQEDYGGYGHDIFHDNQDYGGGEEEGNQSMGEGGFQFDVDEGLPTPQGKRASLGNKKQKLSNETGGMERFSTPGFLEEENFDFNMTESMGPLAVFDEISSGLGVPGSVARSSILTGTVKESLGEEEEEDVLGNGVETSKWSKNTQKAIRVLTSEFAQEKKVTFGEIAEKASKRAAASFFFELLVLSTRDCVKIKQAESFGTIILEPEQKFLELQS